MSKKMTYKDFVQPPIRLQSTQSSRYIKTLTQNINTLNLQLSEVLKKNEEVLKDNEALRSLLIAILSQQGEVRLSDDFLANISYTESVVTTQYDYRDQTTTVRIGSQE